MLYNLKNNCKVINDNNNKIYVYNIPDTHYVCFATLSFLTKTKI